MTYPNHEIPELIAGPAMLTTSSALTSEQEHSRSSGSRPSGSFGGWRRTHPNRDPRPEHRFRPSGATSLSKHPSTPARLQPGRHDPMAFPMNVYQVARPDRPTAARRRVEVPLLRDTRRYGLQVIRMMLSYDPLQGHAADRIALGLIFIGKLGYDLVDKDVRPAANTCCSLPCSKSSWSDSADLSCVNRPPTRLPPADVRELDQVTLPSSRS